MEESTITKMVDCIIETWDLTPTQKTCLYVLAKTIYLKGFIAGENEQMNKE